MLNIATDPLSLVFITCFLVGMFFLIITALLGNLGHGHGGADGGGGHFHLHVGGHAHTAVPHTIGHIGGAHTAGHAPAHAPGHAPGGHGTGSHGHNAQGTHNGHSAQNAQASVSPLSMLFSYVNVSTIVLFLIGFGLFGYVFHNTVHVVTQLALLLAIVGGIVLAMGLVLLLARIFGESDEGATSDVSDRSGMLGKVNMAIPENGLGEVIYVSPGGLRKSVPARSVDGRRLERDQEVVVVNYQRGVAEVETWDHFLNEEQAAGHDAPVAADELEKLRSLLQESDSMHTELVMRKDPQKE
ncbi:MAG: hypothetical protein H0U76_20300 [Ktedonobacteraceae bacterium]|nr:hypothetical protein [Ktedonobacteraceae bacterium]